jgi:proliferating cell nuclear antigen
MKLIIIDKVKKDMFVVFFQLLKNFTNAVNILFHEDYMYIQGMDKSHVCLYDIKVFSSWFDTYEILKEDSKTICVSTSTIHSVLSISQDNQSLHIHFQGDPDKINIDFINDKQLKGEFSRFFEIPLIESELQLLDIPPVDYDAEFSVNAKKMNEITNQLSLFGDTMTVDCCEEKIDISVNGDIGKMLINIPIDDLNEFSISEGEHFKLSYSLHYLHKMCITTKLSQEVSFSISEEYPMKIGYALENDSHVIFFIAPKIDDSD